MPGNTPGEPMVGIRFAFANQQRLLNHSIARTQAFGVGAGLLSNPLAIVTTSTPTPAQTEKPKQSEFKWKTCRVCFEQYVGDKCPWSTDRGSH